MDRDKEFSKFYSENYEKVYRYVKAMLGEGFLAEDIVQDTFLEAWRKYDSIRNYSNKSGWLMRTACLKMKNMNRRAERRLNVALDETMMETAKEDKGYAIKELELFVKKILNEEEQIRFRRYFLWGYSIDKMAVLEGVTQNNARVRICRLVNKLREKILAICFMALTLGNIAVTVCRFFD